ncbi:sugar-binding transcriptional regulator [Levilactobacillus zymae]|uniref:Citrate lyase n=1 Tax=Levilactobacillus zymae TaxID=267363 RepID=A0A1Y6JZY5_9LACO|nr:sugar-binding domain-containing protein [Levilactobacillus zymae]KRL12664.1 citrate lyase regulator [Levilactobacillus zymae DSM 19395]QFR61972.1 sugar-binding transcriptional regulator [Levilactobacillus zymae]GEO72380.1 citrate lyase [Levilactobacillus zymae]SMS15455.1 Citrate lyase transcriptional regulator CitI [Levilactobacillus zymae]
MDDISHQKLLALIAQDYYLSQLSIADLSTKYHLSRYLITKHLDEALKSGVVTISVNDPIARNVALEAEFKRRFDIPNVAILFNAENPAEDADNIVQYAAMQVQTLIEHAHVVGVAWGSTVFSIIDQLNGKIRNDLTFTQFVGDNMKYSSVAGTRQMVEKAAARYGSHYVTLASPLYVINDQIRAALPQEPALKPAFTQAAQMDALFCGFGTLASIESIPVWQEHYGTIFPNVPADRIAGILYGRPYDIDGNFLNQGADKTVGLPLDQLLRTPRRLGVIRNKFKTDAALGALRGKLVTDIVLNEAIAQRILAADV